MVFHQDPSLSIENKGTNAKKDQKQDMTPRHVHTPARAYMPVFWSCICVQRTHIFVHAHTCKNYFAHTDMGLTRPE